MYIHVYTCIYIRIHMLEQTRTKKEKKKQIVCTHVDTYVCIYIEYIFIHICIEHIYIY